MHAITDRHGDEDDKYGLIVQGILPGQLEVAVVRTRFSSKPRFKRSR